MLAIKKLFKKSGNGGEKTGKAGNSSTAAAPAKALRPVSDRPINALVPYGTRAYGTQMQGTELAMAKLDDAASNLLVSQPVQLTENQRSSIAAIVSDTAASFAPVFATGAVSSGMYLVTFSASTAGLQMMKAAGGGYRAMMAGAGGQIAGHGVLTSATALAMLPSLVFTVMTIITAQMHMKEIRKQLKSIEEALRRIEATLLEEQAATIKAAIQNIGVWLNLPDSVRPDFFATHLSTLREIDRVLEQSRSAIARNLRDAKKVDWENAVYYFDDRAKEFGRALFDIRQSMIIHELALRAKFIWTVCSVVGNPEVANTYDTQVQEYHETRETMFEEISGRLRLIPSADRRTYSTKIQSQFEDFVGQYIMAEPEGVPDSMAAFTKDLYLKIKMDKREPVLIELVDNDAVEAVKLQR